MDAELLELVDATLAYAGVAISVGNPVRPALDADTIAADAPVTLAAPSVRSVVVYPAGIVGFAGDGSAEYLNTADPYPRPPLIDTWPADRSKILTPKAAWPLPADPDAGNPGILATFPAMIIPAITNPRFVKKQAAADTQIDAAYGLTRSKPDAPKSGYTAKVGIDEGALRAVTRPEISAPSLANPMVVPACFTGFVGAETDYLDTAGPQLAFSPIASQGLTSTVDLQAFDKAAVSLVRFRMYPSDVDPVPYTEYTPGLRMTDWVRTLSFTRSSRFISIIFEAEAFDTFGNRSYAKTVKQGDPDTEAPSAPPFFAVALTDAGWLFAWGEAEDNYRVDHYLLEQLPFDDRGLITVANVKRTYWLQANDLDKVPGQTYQVRAVDPAGNLSEPCKAFTVPYPVSGIGDVAATWINGTNKVQVYWTVNPAGTNCAAFVVDENGRIISNSVTSNMGNAVLTMRDGVRPGNYRVKVFAV